MWGGSGLFEVPDIRDGSHDRFEPLMTNVARSLNDGYDSNVMKWANANG